MNKFIYVFTEEDKEKLLKQGFSILKNDAKPYVFANNEKVKIDFEDVKATYGNAMYF